MIPRYRDTLLNAFLVGTRDPDAFLRASSLSNIAEICKLLKYSLGPIIHEVRLTNRRIGCNFFVHFVFLCIIKTLSNFVDGVDNSLISVGFIENRKK